MKKIRETLFQCRTPFVLTRFFLSLKNVKKFVKLYLHSSKTKQDSFRFDEIFFSFEKCQKIRETVFTFKQNSAELLLFWRDFFRFEKCQKFVKLYLHSSKTSKLCLRPQFWKSWLRTSLSLDPVKGFGTQSSSKFKFQLLKGKIVSYLLKFSQLFFQCWKGRWRKRFAPEIGAYHLNYRFSVLMNLFKLSQQILEKENQLCSSQRTSLSFNSNWASGPRWVEPTRASAALMCTCSALRPHLKRSVRPLCVPSLAPLGISNNNGFLRSANDHWLSFISWHILQLLFVDW